jgi:hypothetical protein
MAKFYHCGSSHTNTVTVIQHFQTIFDVDLPKKKTKKKKQEPVEPGDAPRIGFGHRKVYLL